MPRNGRYPIGELAARSGWVGSVVRFWAKTYAPDYASVILLAAAYVAIELFQEPFHRMFFINNMNLEYPHTQTERVPVTWNIFYAAGVPLVTLLIILSLLRAGVHKFHVTLLGLFISIFLTTFLTDVIKNAVGRPRPDLISRCKPAVGTPRDTLVTIDVCTETDHHTLHDGWRSFPSGHSSFAFSGLGFLALFVAGQLHVFRPRADLGRALLCFTPLFGAAMIAISRCEDYRHDVYDVTCGSILGMTIAYFSYRRYYPALSTKTCHEPYPSREVSFNEGLGKLKGDEEQAMMRGAGDHDCEDHGDDREA